jgi:hypothetical protein
MVAACAAPRAAAAAAAAAAEEKLVGSHKVARAAEKIAGMDPSCAGKEVAG